MAIHTHTLICNNSVEEVAAKSFGVPSKGENGKVRWSGVIGYLSRGEVDFSYGPLAVSPARSRAMDFTLGFMDNFKSLMVPRHPAGIKSMSINASAFMSLFTGKQRDCNSGRPYFCGT